MQKLSNYIAAAALALLAIFTIWAALPDRPKPLTAEQMVEQHLKEDAKIEAIKLKCVLLSRTPVSAMSPVDLSDWSFCKQIMTTY